jgi:hypothetical protein
MPYSPPHWLESLAAALVPPASAEHVLGDLAECSRSDREYRRNLASILPRVIWSQIRRRATIGGIVFHGVLTALALLVFQGVPTAKYAFYAEPWAPLRLAAVGMIWVLGCALAAAYGPAGRPFTWNRRVFIAAAVAAVGAAALLDVPVLRVVLALSAVYATILVLSMPWLQPTAPPPLSPDTLAAHARQFQRVIWWRNARESFACVLVLGFNVRGLWTAGTALDRAANLLIIAAVAFIMGFLHLRAQSRAVPAAADAKTIWQFHRHEIARQRDILQAIVWWYLMPFVPGFIVMTIGRWQERAVPTLIGTAIVLALFVCVWRLNVWGARRLDGELQKVDALEGQL